MPADLSSKRVLIVDDSKTNVKLLVDALKGHYRVGFALSGENALSYVNNNRTDLVLLDIEMPGLDGYEVCQALKENPATCDIPVIFITVSSTVGAMSKGFSLGAVDYITKPFEIEEVLARVRTHLLLRHTHEELVRANTLLLEEIEQRRKANRLLSESEKMLIKANQTKDKFFSIISHDLKGPINALLGFTELLDNRYDSFTEEKKKEYVRILRDSSEHLHKLVENLLQWARMQLNKLEWLPAGYDLATITRPCLSLARSNAHKKDIVLKTKLPDNLKVYVDANMLAAVLRNLVGAMPSNSRERTGLSRSLQRKRGIW